MSQARRKAAPGASVPIVPIVPKVTSPGIISYWQYLFLIEQARQD
jgi:hypothetical protein